MSSLSPANNLPSQLTPLVSREPEIAQITTLINKPEVRLITLVGPGGIGKTRLAIEIALSQLNQFQDSIFLIALTSVREPELVLSSIAQALEVKETAGQSLKDSLSNFLQGKELLLVLDNFEQVAQAAPELVGLLEASPGLKLLVTSRIPLELKEENIIVVSPLALPDADTTLTPETLEKIPAVALFLQQAQLGRFDFKLSAENAATVAEICQRLDGLPLALELAAARIKTLSPQALLARLNNRLKLLTGGPRNWATHQQTLRATIEWSYELLNQEEKQAFTQLSVLEGDWNIGAAEAICTPASPTSTPDADSSSDTPAPQTEVANQNQEKPATNQLEATIQSLTSKSLLVQNGRGIKEEQRYRMLETIREYGLEKLAQSGDNPRIRKQHAVYYLELAEETAAKLTGPEQAYWLSYLDREYPNLRAALTYSLASAEASGDTSLKGLRLGIALGRYWQIRGYLNEGFHWLEASLQCSQELLNNEPDGTSDKLLQLHFQALTLAGTLARDKGDYQSANALLEQSLDLQRRQGNKAGVAMVLNTLGAVAANQGEFAKALALLEESLVLRQELADRRGQAVTLCNIAAIKNSSGEFTQAKDLYDEALVFLQELGDPRTMSMLWNNYGEVQKALQDFSAARASFEKSLALKQELGDKLGCAYSYASLGELANLQANYGLAQEFFSKALRLLQEFENSRYLAICLEGLATTFAAYKELEMAARCLGAAEALREKIGAPLEPVERERYEATLATVRTLNSEDFSTAWAEGRDLPLAETLDLLLMARR